MFEQDYIMRLIRQIIRMILMILFHFDIDKEEENIEKEQQEVLETLYDLVDEGQINEAENQLCELVDGIDKQRLKTALLFYNYLNEKEDSFLEKHDFTREEIREGVERMASLYGVEGMAEAFREW